MTMFHMFRVVNVYFNPCVLEAASRHPRGVGSLFALGGAPQLLTARVTSEATLYVLPFDEVEIMLGQASRLHLLQRQAHLLRARALNE